MRNTTKSPVSDKKQPVGGNVYVRVFGYLVGALSVLAFTVTDAFLSYDGIGDSFGEVKFVGALIPIAAVAAALWASLNPKLTTVATLWFLVLLSAAGNFLSLSGRYHRQFGAGEMVEAEMKNVQSGRQSVLEEVQAAGKTRIEGLKADHAKVSGELEARVADVRKGIEAANAEMRYQEYEAPVPGKGPSWQAARAETLALEGKLPGLETELDGLKAAQAAELASLLSEVSNSVLAVRIEMDARESALRLRAEEERQALSFVESAVQIYAPDNGQAVVGGLCFLLSVVISLGGSLSLQMMAPKRKRSGTKLATRIRRVRSEWVACMHAVTAKTAKRRVRRAEGQPKTRRARVGKAVNLHFGTLADAEAEVKAYQRLRK